MRRGRIYLSILALALAIPAILLAATGLYLGRAEALASAGLHPQAVANFESAAMLSPWRPELWERAAAAALEASQPERTIADMAHVTVPSLHGYLLLGSAHTLRGDLGSALLAYEAALEHHAPIAAVYSGIAEVQRRRGDLGLESIALQAKMRLDPGTARDHYRLGLLLMFSEPDLALTAFAQAAELDAAFEPAVQTLRSGLKLSATETESERRWITLGRALGLVAEWSLAEEAFGRALQADANHAEAWAWLGEAEQQNGADGRAELDRALSLDGRSAVVRGLRGLYWKRQGRAPQALAEYLLAAGLEPVNWVWQRSIGESYEQLGNLTAALAAHQHATDLAPDDASPWRSLALFTLRNATFVEEVGLPAAQRAALLAPNDSPTLDALGWSYLSTGRLSLAERTLVRALQNDPAHLSLRLHLAMTYLAQGNLRMAYDHLRSVADSGVDGIEAPTAAQLLLQYFP